MIGVLDLLEAGIWQGLRKPRLREPPSPP